MNRPSPAPCERCPRDATADDGLCNRHRAADRTSDLHRRRRDQAEFAYRWQQAHPDELRPVVWPCPLCREPLPWPDDETATWLLMTRTHVATHGADWTAYCDLNPDDGVPLMLAALTAVAARRAEAGRGRD
jgi:hypothetical protein